MGYKQKVVYFTCQKCHKRDHVIEEVNRCFMCDAMLCTECNVDIMNVCVDCKPILTELEYEKMKELTKRKRKSNGRGTCLGLLIIMLGLFMGVAYGLDYEEWQHSWMFIVMSLLIILAFVSHIQSKKANIKDEQYRETLKNRKSKNNFIP